MANVAPGRIVARRLTLSSTALLGVYSSSESEDEADIDSACNPLSSESEDDALVSFMRSPSSSELESEADVDSVRNPPHSEPEGVAMANSARSPPGGKPENEADVHAVRDLPGSKPSADAVSERMANIQISDEANSEPEPEDSGDESMHSRAMSISTGVSAEESDHGISDLAFASTGELVTPMTANMPCDTAEQLLAPDSLPQSVQPQEGADDMGTSLGLLSPGTEVLHLPEIPSADMASTAELTAPALSEGGGNDDGAADMEDYGVSGADSALNPDPAIAGNDRGSELAAPVAVVAKPKRRIAPILVTAELSDSRVGNIADQCDSDEPIDSLGPPASVLPITRAQKQLRSAFNGSARMFESRPRMCQIRRQSVDMLERPTTPDFLDAPGETFWFCRAHDNRFTSANVERADSAIRAALWSCMTHVQAQHRSLIRARAMEDGQECAEDPVLPLYGDSDDDGELSDSLMREIAQEQKEADVRKAKAAEAETRREAMVTAVIREMVEKYALDWHNRVQPKLESSAFHLWGRYIARRDVLQQRLADLRDRRLLKEQQSVISSGVSTPKQARALCSGLRVTIEDIAQISWLLKLLAKPRPLRLPHASPMASDDVQADNMPSDAVAEADSVTDAIDDAGETEHEAPPASDGSCSGSSDDMADFIDDEDDPGYHARQLVTMSVPVELDSSEKQPRRPPLPRRGIVHRRRGPRHAAAGVNRYARRARSADRHESGQSIKQTLYDDISEGESSGEEMVDALQLESALTNLLGRYSADDMYTAVLFYIRRMALGSMAHIVAEDDASDKQQMPDINIESALRIWTEFENWVVELLPIVRVQYPSVDDRDRAQARMDKLKANDADQSTTGPDDQRIISRHLKRIARSCIRCPVQEPQPDSLPDTDASVLGPTELLIATSILPGMLSVTFDDDIAKMAAFRMFYDWRCDLNVGQAANEADSLDVDDAMPWTTVPPVSADPDESMLQGVSQMSLSEPEESAASEAGVIVTMSDAGTNSETTDHTGKGDAQLQIPKKRARAASESSSEDTRDMLVISDVSSDAGSPLPNVEPGEEDSAADKTGRSPKRGRRNIKEIRGEDSAVLRMRRQQENLDAVIQRRIAERNAAKSAATAGNSVSDDGSSDEEVLVSGSTTAPASALADGAAEAAARSPHADTIGTRVLINEGHSDDQQSVYVPGFIGGHLKDHQIDGIQFMWKNIVMLSDHSADGGLDSSRANSLPAQHGCVLAHSMGLGKTLQTISLIYTLLNEVHRGNPDFANSIFSNRRVLILCPVTVQANWASEFWKWTGVDHNQSTIRKYMAIDGPLLPAPFDIPTGRELLGSERQRILKTVRAIRSESKQIITQVINYGLMKKPEDRLAALRLWHARGGIMIMGYSGFRDVMHGAVFDKSSFDVLKSKHDDIRQALRSIMLSDGPSLVVADEGHTIKNPKTKLAVLANALQTKARICLTGYPLQNNLEEYWTMVDFCFPGYLGNISDFRNNYVNPIKNGLYADSSVLDRRRSTLMMRTLQKLLDKLVDRRDSNILSHQLPRKVEYVISCPLTKMQSDLYERYLAAFLGIIPGVQETTRARNENLFQHGMVLLTICNHPAVCRALLDMHRQQQESRSGNRRVLLQDDALDLSDSEIVNRRNANTHAGGDATLVDVDSELGQQITREDWCRDIFAAHADHSALDGAAALEIEGYKQPTHCTKVLMMLDIIRQSVRLGERVLVFSRSIPTLDYLQWITETTGAAATDDGEAPKALRIDGHTPTHKRSSFIDSFNAPGSRNYVFFISSGTGSIGINLVAASRVILFDIGWNPLYDEQAVARAYRYGQKKRVYVYRLLTTGTWENKLFDNNIFKVGMTRRVVDKQLMGRQSMRNDMKKYFRSLPVDPPSISSANIQQLLEENNDDYVLASILAKYAHVLSNVAPRATLLVNEDDTWQAEDRNALDAMVLREQQRLGLMPVSRELLDS
ncbi:hypothetical protein IWW50_002755, partial [Coemansia erecta]